MKYHSSEFLPDDMLSQATVSLVRTSLITQIANEAKKDLCLTFSFCVRDQEEATTTVRSDTSFGDQVEGIAQLRFAQVRRGFAKKTVVAFSLECKFQEEPVSGTGLCGFTACGEFKNQSPILNSWTGLYNQFDTPWYGWRGE